MDTDASEEEDKEDQESESDQEIENTQVEETDLAEENNATMHVAINGIVYETENVGALATLLRPYITRPTPAIPAPVIQIHAPDTQLTTTQAA
ncbi:hypothetical protein B484DRAFT_409837 [Ochromonadaceae sp. CCMP2298]|nr:hypothetical protein B484DRAFT_409837 [Ochromonadaceae sp. CCMP2298]